MGSPSISDSLTRLGVSVLPVFAFLLGLQFLDSYKLVPLRRILGTVLVGCGVAAACLFINTLAFLIFHANAHWYALFGAPPIEELLKAAYVIYLIRSSRVGFLVDAAICGFAVGAGFAVVENLFYLHALADNSLLLWIIRGFGTAMMHGGTTSVVGIISSSLTERRTERRWHVFVPGLMIAVVIHSAYNRALVPPLTSTLAILIGLPVILILIFVESENSLQKWLGDKLDKDIDLLRMISTGRFAETKAGSFLRSLKKSFPPEIVGDMLCLVQLSSELSARAKGDLLRREAGFPVLPDPSLGAKFKELAYLQKSIGRAGKLAIAPLMSLSPRDLWEMHMLSQGAKPARQSPFTKWLTAIGKRGQT